ncbi:MAG: glycosyltransferase [Sphingobacteriales bacterium]
MISVIISSANNTLLKQVTENITATIGVPFEIIAIDNSTGKLGICAVYNQGAQQAQYDILCFMHEDIIIETQGWGTILEDTFTNHPEIGLLGVVGGGYKPFTNSSWSGLGYENVFCNFIQSYKYEKKETYLDYRNPNNKTSVDFVACVDGLWLATTKKIATEIKFDEDTFKGFHAYDLDFSIAVGQKYKVAVTFEILMNHLSDGSYSRDWVEENFRLHKKWAKQLPINAQNYTFKQRAHMEKVTYKDFVKKLIKLGFPVSIAYDILKDKRYRDMGIYWKLRFFLFKKFTFKNNG